MAWTTEKIKAMRAQRIADGLCEKCGQLRGAKGTTRKCRKCADGEKARTAQTRKEKGIKPQIFICKEGKCVTCGYEPPVVKGEFQECEQCYFKLLASMYLGSRKRWKEIKTLWEEQGGVCPYTGIQLEFGIDASLDHIQPASRFPELSQDTSNFEFIHYRVNEMKRDMTKEEFLEFLFLINAHLKLEEDPSESWKKGL